MFGLSIKEKLVDIYNKADDLDESGILSSSKEKITKASEKIADLSGDIAKMHRKLSDIREDEKSAKKKLKDLKSDKKEDLLGKNFRKNHPIWGKIFLPTSIPILLLSPIAPHLMGAIKGGLSRLSFSEASKEYKARNKQIKAQKQYLKRLDDNKAEYIANISGLEKKLNRKEVERNELMTLIKETHKTYKTQIESLITIKTKMPQIEIAKDRGIITEEFYNFVVASKKAMLEQDDLPYGVDVKDFNKMLKDYCKAIEVSMLKGSNKTLDNPSIFGNNQNRENTEENEADNEVSNRKKQQRKSPFKRIKADYYVNLDINGEAIQAIANKLEMSVEDFFGTIGVLSTYENVLREDMDDKTIEETIENEFDNAYNEYNDEDNQDKDYHITGAKVFKNALIGNDLELNENMAQVFFSRTGVTAYYNKYMEKLNQNQDLDVEPELGEKPEDSVVNL